MEKRIEIVDVRRRALLKSGLAASAAMTIGLPVSAEEKAAATASEDGIAWHKGVCRFCGTGCGLLVGVKNGRASRRRATPTRP